LKEAVATAQQTGLQAMRAAGATVEPLRIAEMPEQFSKDLPALYNATAGKTNTAQLIAALTAFHNAAEQTDNAMAKAESAGDATTMQKLAAEESTARAAFYMPGGLTFNKYYHSIDRVFMSYPEVMFAGSDAQAQQAAIDRITTSIQNATAALK
jgi:hypothetical protein